MSPGNLIPHLPLQARNLAVTLESDLSLSHPTYNPLPSSIASSPKCLLCATPPLHWQSLRLVQTLSTEPVSPSPLPDHSPSCRLQHGCLSGGSKP